MKYYTSEYLIARLPKLIYRFDTLPIRIPGGFFVPFEKNIQSNMKMKGAHNSWNNPEETKLKTVLLHLKT